MRVRDAGGVQGNRRGSARRRLLFTRRLPLRRRRPRPARRRGQDADRQDWQFRDKGSGQGLSRDGRVRRQNRTCGPGNTGACIFLNQPGFARGIGCALHNKALKLGVVPLDDETKCAGNFRSQPGMGDRPDGSEILKTTITELRPPRMGRGGLNLHWYCTGGPAAHVGKAGVEVLRARKLTELSAKTTMLSSQRSAKQQRFSVMVAIHPATRLAGRRADAAIATPGPYRPSGKRQVISAPSPVFL